MEWIDKLLDAAPDAMTVVDATGRIVIVNAEAERMFGWPRQVLLGGHIELLIPERFHQAHMVHRARFHRARASRPMGSGLELSARRRDGSEFPVEISLSPLTTEEGTLISASIRDVSERKRIERETRDLQSHLLSAVESIQGAFAIFDEHDALVLCNGAFAQLVGNLAQTELAGRTFDAIAREVATQLRFEDDVAGRPITDGWAECHRAPPGRVDARTHDGRCLRIAEQSTAEQGSVTTIWDVSDAVAREQELDRARRAAEEASAAKSEFLASISHELRTPLNVMLGFAQLLRRDRTAPLSEAQAKRIDHVLEGGETLARMIESALDLSRDRRA
jgi:PAS domain S-box-containing protein